MQLSGPADAGPARHPGRAHADRTAAIWLAGFALLCFVYFLPRWNSYNEDARVDVTLSIVDRASVNINPYRLNTGDETKVGKNFYSNKAPGQSLLGVPVYAFFKAALAIGPVRSLVNGVESSSAWKYALKDAACPPPHGSTDHCRFVTRPKLDFALLQYLEAAATAAIPSILFLLLFFWFLGFFSESTFDRTVLTAAVGLATIVFPYSQLFFSHVPAMALDFLGFVLVYSLTGTHAQNARVPRWLAERPNFGLVLAGCALGLSVV